MHQRAHAADALGEGPGVARVAAAQDDLDAAHHGAGGGGRVMSPCVIGFRLDAQVAFDAGDGVDDDAFAHVGFILVEVFGDQLGEADHSMSML